MGDISGKVYDQVIESFVKQIGGARMRAAESARAVGQETRLSTQAVESAKEFQQQESRQYQTDIARILAQLYGYQMGYASAGVRAQYNPDLLISEYQRLGDSKKRTSEEINEVIKSPISNERYGIEVAELNNMLESLDFRDPNTYTQFNRLIDGLKRKYEVAPLGSKKKIVLEDRKLGGFGAVEKSVKLWSSIYGDPIKLKRARNVLGLEGEQNIELNDDVGLLKRKATIKDVFTKLLFSDVIQGNANLLAQSAGYENAQSLINNFANEWCDDDVQKANAVETMQQILKANGLDIYAGGAVRPDEWNISEKIRNRVKLSAVQAGIQANIPGYFPPSEKTLDKETVDSLLNKVERRKTLSKTPPEEYTLPMIDSLVSDEIPAFTNEASKSNVQKEFLNSMNGKIQRILNGEVNANTATKELMENYLLPKVVDDDFVITTYPFIKKSQYRAIYNLLVKETNGKAKLSSHAEQDLNLK